jgi:hypothetical protein
VAGGERQEVGEQPTHAVTRLQPENSDDLLEAEFDEELDEELDRYLDDIDLNSSLTSATHDQTEFNEEEKQAADDAVARERLLQRQREGEVVEELRAQGFTGPKYEILKTELVLYVMPVLRCWIRLGRIYRECRAAGRPIKVADHERAHLAKDFDERLSLAGLVAAKGLVLLHDRAFLGGQWTPEGGASLRTFYVGACVLAFPGVFRAWQRQEERRRRDEPVDDVRENDRPLFHRMAADPAEAIANEQFLIGKVDQLPERIRPIAARLLVTDETLKDIGNAVGLNDRQVEGRLKRFRESTAGSEWRQG